MEKEKSRAQQLADELLYQAPDVFEARPELKEPAWAFCEGYRHFLNRAKTEREFVAGAVSLLQAAGYTLYEPGRTYRPGDQGLLRQPRQGPAGLHVRHLARE